MKTEKAAGIITRLLAEQFAIDYSCTVGDFCNKETLVTELRPNAQARWREETGLLSVLSYRGKLVISAAPELIEWGKSVLAKHCSAEWCFEAGTLISIDRKLQEFGYEISQAHLFFTPGPAIPTPVHTVRFLHGEEITKLKDDERIDEAFLFEDSIEDVLGAAIYDDTGELLAVSGATANSERMWEMGFNSFVEGKGYATSVLSALTQEVLKRGKVPYSGTALSHLASQNVSLHSGLIPTFCELTTKKSK
ncbi:MAG: hypothetical protein PUA83_05495 [Clostridiales bacterium]|nr:hypothetical protein [Clostridiales bacterium]